MLTFKVHQLGIGGRCYLLLPKLSRSQVRQLAARMVGRGYSVKLNEALAARSREGSIHVDPSGFCWSTIDPADAVLPAIPEILDLPKDRIPLGLLESMYVKFGPPGSRSAVRVSTRVENYAHWDELRETGASGLAPDEHAVVSFLLKRAGTSCEMLTDFPVDDSRVRICGRKVYYESKVECTEAMQTLRVVGRRSPRNSYLNRDGLLKLRGFSRPSRKEWLGLFSELGDWCSFVPE